MTDEELKKIIEETAERAASITLNKLKSNGKVRYHFPNSFKKTEELLYLCGKLPDTNPEKQRVLKALEIIQDDEYRDVIVSRYFDGMTFDELAEIYDCQDRTIVKNRTRLVKILAKELFPEDVLKELLNQ